MWTETSVIVLIFAFTTARPKHGVDEHYHKDYDFHDDHHNVGKIMNKCSNSTGYPMAKVFNKMDQKKSFCKEDPAKAWITCFYKKTGAMDKNHVLNETLFTERFSYDKGALKIVKECITDAKKKNDKERACALEECFQRNDLDDEDDDDFEDEDYDDDYDHHEHHYPVHVHHHYHYHHHHHYHHHQNGTDIHNNGKDGNGKEFGSGLEEDGGLEIFDENAGGREPLNDNYENKENDGDEPSK